MGDPLRRAIDTVPNHAMKGGVERYLYHGISGGGFLTAVLENDFKGVVGKADYVNIGLLKEWASWVYNDCPSRAQGSPRAVDDWVASGGYLGIVSASKPESATAGLILPGSSQVP